MVQGTRSQQMKRLLWHEWQDFSQPPPLSRLIKFKVLGLASRIFLYLTIWFTCQCPSLWLFPSPAPPRVTPAFLPTYFMNVYVLSPIRCALGSDLQTPALSERILPQAQWLSIFLLLSVGSASQLLISLGVPFLWNNYRTPAQKDLYWST